MPVKLVPPSRNAAAEQLMKLFAQTEQKLIAEITRKRAAGYVDYAETAALRRVRETMQKMVDESAKYVPLAIEKEFYKGEKHAAGYKNARQVVTPGRTRAAEILTDNLLGQIQEMAGNALADATAKMQLIGRPEADIFRTLGLRTASQNVAIGASGMGGVEAMARALEASGITAFVDKAGRPWSLRAYGNMAVRTTVKQAQVSAVLTEDDHDLYQIVRHNAPCRLCATYSGRVYSKSGTNPHYPPLAMAFGKIDLAGPNDLSNSFLNIHPNCLCSIQKYTEAGKTEKQIEQMREASSFAKHPADVDPRTQKEIESYRRKERNRAELMGVYHEWERMREQGVAGVPTSFNRFWDEYKKDSPLYNRWFSSYTPPPKNKPKPVQPAPTAAPAPVQQPNQNNPVLQGLKASNVSRKDIDWNAPQRTDAEIIATVGGADKTNGSCSSLAFAFIGNKAGGNVRDFRGGNSCNYFSRMSNIKQILGMNGVDSKIVQNTDDFKAAKELLKDVVKDKLYYFSSGRHAAIIRRVDNGLEYLELQSATKNGFHPLDSTVLKRRFRCQKSHTVAGTKYEATSVIAEAESLENNVDFREILCYINTDEAAQMKGAGGGVK